VNITANVEQLPLADNSVASIIAISTFEHVRHFWIRVRGASSACSSPAARFW
jgi:hypothetical protein